MGRLKISGLSGKRLAGEAVSREISRLFGW